jgi:GntR family transcriptional repressor for pyruvate dehydrogenase complex
VLRNSPEHLAERLEESEAMVRAIRSKNSAQASAEMRRHILRESQRMGIELNIPDDHMHN